MKVFNSFTSLLPITLVGLSCLGGASGHTWTEYLEGPSGVKGYSRNDQGRMPGVNLSYFHRRIKNVATEPICGERQRWPIQDEKHPRLIAAPGDTVTAYYRENGHLSLDPFKGKKGPGSGPGTVYWYGTESEDRGITIAQAMLWNEAGTGGDRKGRKLGQSPFDDGHCSEANGSPFYTQRKSVFKKGGDISLCTSKFKLPEAAAAKANFISVFMLWDYSKKDSNIKDHSEWYTVCHDINWSSKIATQDKILANNQPVKTPNNAKPPVGPPASAPVDTAGKKTL